MRPQDSREATLRRLVRDARAEKPADVDWSDVEERLLREARRATPAPRRASFPLTWGAVALAAAAAVWLVTQRTPVANPDAARALSSVRESALRDGDALPVGSRVVAVAEQVAVNHAGRALWMLAPGSSAVLAERGEHLTLRLERGAVWSRVVPNPKPETFVVEAAGSRIAVHGTVFRVGLEGGRVVVNVSEGTVAVGPIGGEHTFLLKAPARGDFAADGRSGRVDGEPGVGASEPQPSAVRTPVVRGASPLASASAAPPSASVEPPSEPTISDIEGGIARVVDTTVSCFRQHTQSAEGVEITVRTALTLKVAASGAVANIDFQPPLSPDVEACASAGIARITFAVSKQGASVTRLLELKR